MAEDQRKFMDLSGAHPNRHVFYRTPEMVLAERELFEQRSTNHIHVFGPRRHGKTTLSQYIWRVAPEKGFINVFADLRTISHTSDNFSMTIKSLYSSIVYDLKRQATQEGIIDPEIESRKFFDSISGIEDPVELGRMCFDHLSALSDKLEQPIYISLEEIDSLLLKTGVGDVLIHFLQQQQKAGKDSNLLITTSSLRPLPWMTQAHIDFARTVPHIRIRKLTSAFAPSLAEAMPFDDPGKSLEAASFIVQQTGGYGGLISHAVARTHYDSTNLRDVFSQMADDSSRGHLAQLETGEEYIERLDNKERRAALDIYQDLISGDADRTAQADPVTAFHLALSGLVELHSDDVTLGPVAPFIRRALDQKWIDFRLQIIGSDNPETGSVFIPTSRPTQFAKLVV